jgi:predicted transposase YdaD
VNLTLFSLSFTKIVYLILNAVPRLRAMGLNVEQIAASLGLAIATVETYLEPNK